MAQFEQGQPENISEEGIHSHNFGGLNTTASPLNVPFEDSPYLVNCITDISGNVLKRPGTQVLFKENTAADGVGMVPFATGLNYNFLVVKRGLGISVFEVRDDNASLVVQKNNVFDERARYVRPSIVSTSEVEPRVLFFTGTNKPVQLKFIEQQHVKTGLTNTFVFTNAFRLKNATLSNAVFFINRERVVPTSMVYTSSGDTLTVTTAATYPAGTVSDLVVVLWQWWAEGQALRGDRFFSSTNRFNVVSTDQNVKVPLSLITDLDPDDAFVNNYGIQAFKRSSRTTGSQYTRKTDGRPQTADEFSYGDGSSYTYDINSYVNPSPFFLTFGLIQSPNTPTTVYMLRRRNLKFNNRTGALSQFVEVFVDGEKRTAVLAGGSTEDQVYKNYWLFDTSGNAINTASVATARAKNISFEANRLGVPPQALVEMVNTENTHIGAASIRTRFNYDDGSYIIAYGLGQVADYVSGYYPRNAAIYQGRLVLGGFANRPLTVLFSSVNDTTVPGQFYMDFTITDDNASLDTRPFDIIINGRPDDRVVACVEWQASLFVLTRKAVYRVHGGQNVISPSNRYVNYISATGCVNASSVVQTDFNVVYLSDTGLYDLTPQVENGEYQVRERSIKIRDKFGLTDDPAYEELPWVEYDVDERYVMVGYPAPQQFIANRYLYVYNTFRDSWTEYATPGGFNTFHGTNYVDRQNGSRFCASISWTLTPTTSSDFLLLKFSDSKFVDFRQIATYEDGAEYPLPPKLEVVHTASKKQQHFGISYFTTRQIKAFPPHPLGEVQDINVEVSMPSSSFRQQLVQGVDFVKEPNGTVYLFSPLPDGGKVYIRPQIVFDNYKVEGYGQCVFYADNLLTQEVVVFNGTSWTPETAVAGTKLEWGQGYIAVYTTPMFMLQSLGKLKRMKHAYLYFDNKSIQSLFTAADVNSVSGQVPAAIVDTFKTKAQCNISMVYSSEVTGETSADIYGSEELFWDESAFDIAAPNAQNEIYQLFKEPIQGVGYSFQMSVWSYDPHTFKLCGYMIDATQKGKRYIRK